MRVAYLGPAGTFSEDALAAATAGSRVEPVAAPSVYEAIAAVAAGTAERALVPFENSIDGSVRATLDALAFDVAGVTIVGEIDHPITHSLIARREVPLTEITAVISHPQASAQCARFIRERLPGAEVRAAPSTADAVRQVGESEQPWAALGTRSAARLYDCAILAVGVEDSTENVTRFVWIAPEGTEPTGAGSWRTTLVFSEIGEDHPGVLVDALREFSDNDVNLTRIESRPMRTTLGRYMFFVDLQGRVSDPAVERAIAGLRTKAESVRILGSYPVGEGPALS